VVARLVVEVRGLKLLLKFATGLMALAVLGWIGVFVYWHVRITSAIQTIQKTPSQLHRPGPNPELLAYLSLTQSGCRVLPYCVRAIDSSNDLIFNSEILRLIRDRIRSPHVTYQIINGIVEQFGENAAQADADLLLSCEIKEKDSEEMRALKCRRVYEWWNEKGRTYHQWWRLWSSRCH